MSKGPKRKQCEGKARHASHEAAMIACGALKKRTGARLFPYKCPHCPYWHNGHNPRRAGTDDAAKNRKRPWI